MTEVFDCADAAQRPAGIASAISALKGGRLVVLPTDTVYGIGADAFDGRPSPPCCRPRGGAGTCRCRCWSAPGTRSTGWSTRCPSRPAQLIRAFWPGALSLVVQQAPSLQWDLGDAQRHRRCCGCRCTRWRSSCSARSARWRCRARTSPAAPPAVTAADARDQLGDLVEVYLDGRAVRRAARRRRSST